MSITASNNPFPDSPDLSPTKLDKGGYDGTAETLDTKIDDMLAEAILLINNTLVGSASVGSIVPSSIPPATGAVHAFATQAGTYTNWGGYVIPANTFAFISRSSDLVFSISQTTLDVTGKLNVSDVVNNLTSTETTKPLSAAQGKILNEKNVKIKTWTAIAFASGDQVTYLGKDWTSNATTLSTDVPGTSSKWVERLTAYTPKTTFSESDNANPSTMKIAAYHIGDKNLINKGFTGYGALNDADLNVLHNAIIFCRFYWNGKEVLTTGWSLELLYVRKSDGLVQMRLYDASRVNQRSFGFTFSSTVGKQYLSGTDAYQEGQFFEIYLDWDKVPSGFTNFSVPVYVNYNSLVDFKGFNYLFDNRYNTKFDERVTAKSLVNTTTLSTSEKNAIMVARGFMPNLGINDTNFATINNAIHHIELILSSDTPIATGDYIEFTYVAKESGIIQMRKKNAAGTTLVYYQAISATHNSREILTVNDANGYYMFDVDWNQIPAGHTSFATSLRVNYKYNSSGLLLFNKRFDDRIVNSTKDWSSKKWCSFGDSITAIGNSNDATCWQTLVNAKSGFTTHYGRGIGGTSFKYHTGTFWANPDGSYAADGGVAQPVGTTLHINALSTWDRISKQIPTDSDLVFLMGGTNDWNGNNPIGDTVYLPSSTTDTLWNTYKGAGDFNILSFKGGLASAIVKIQTRVPNAVLVIGTLLSGAGETAGVNMTAERVNGIGLKPSDYRKATIEVANEFGIPIIDVFSNTGINQFNRATYISDQFHPYSIGGLNKGNKALSRAVSGGLTVIKPNF